MMKSTIETVRAKQSRCNISIFRQIVDGVHTPSIRFDEISSMINQKKVIAHDEVESRQGI